MAGALRSAVASLRAAFSRRPPPARRLAAEVDFRTACPLLELNERIVAGLRGEEEVLAAYNELRTKWAQAPLAHTIPFANDSMTIQLAEMFQHLHDIDAGDSSAPVRLPRLATKEARASAAFEPSIGPSSHTNPLPTLSFQMKALHEDAEADAEADVRLQLQQRLGFALWTGPSQAATGPYTAGVYLRGKAPRGSVVALYPGAVYNGEMLQKGVDCGHLGNPAVRRMLVPRLDEAVIDTFAAAAPKTNPYALAHHVRHPPPGVTVNVMRLQVDFVDAGSAKGGGAAWRPGSGDLLPFPPHLRPYVPNVWGADISGGQALYSSLEQDVWAKGSVLIALRELWDEEIFVDHTLNPFAGQALLVPPWAEEEWRARKEIRRLSGRVSWETANAVRASQFIAMHTPLRVEGGAAAAQPALEGGSAGDAASEQQPAPALPAAQGAAVADASAATKGGSSGSSGAG